MATPRKDPARSLRGAMDTRSHRFRRLLTEEWLRPRWERGDTLVEMAQEADCSVSTVSMYVARLGLGPRPARRREQGWDEVLTPEYLEATYVEARMTTEAIAAEVGTTAGTVVRWLAAAGIPRRGHQPGVDNLLYEAELTPERLARRLDEGASVAEIAKEVGCTSPAVRLAAARAGLADRLPDARPARPPCAPPDELRRLYEAGLALDAIAARLGVSRTKVRADLSRFGIRPYARPGFRQTDGAWADGGVVGGSRADKAPRREGRAAPDRRPPARSSPALAAPLVPTDLTPAAAAVLAGLARGPVTDPSGRAVERLREACGIADRATTSALVVQLDGLGLVVRERNASRTYAVAITEAGRRALSARTPRDRARTAPDDAPPHHG